MKVTKKRERQLNYENRYGGDEGRINRWQIKLEHN